jgi:hypothetical protein
MGGQRAGTSNGQPPPNGNGASQPQPKPAGATFLPGPALVAGVCDGDDHADAGDVGCSKAAAAARA